MIEAAIGNPDELKKIETSLGLVTEVRVVQNAAEQTSQKVNTEEFVTA